MKLFIMARCCSGVAPLYSCLKKKLTSFSSSSSPSPSPSFSQFLGPVRLLVGYAGAAEGTAAWASGAATAGLGFEAAGVAGGAATGASAGAAAAVGPIHSFPQVPHLTPGAALWRTSSILRAVAVQRDLDESISPSRNSVEVASGSPGFT
jgi:hypothetical protein